MGLLHELVPAATTIAALVNLDNLNAGPLSHPDFGVRKSLRDLSSLAHVQEARTSPSTGWARMARDMNDQKVVAAYARVAGPGWLVFVELPIGEWTKY